MQANAFYLETILIGTMYKNLLNYLAFLLLFPSCSGVKPHISIVCEENNIGNSIVKWETIPLIQGNVKVYASTNPNQFPDTNPIAVANIADQRITLITADPSKRYYYKLVFNEKYPVKIATRNINIPDIQNFRDLGGYPSYSHKKQIRWGKLYRSAEINELKDFAYRELKDIGIKTIIDLRCPEELKNKKPLQPGFQVINIPLPVENLDQILLGLQQQTVLSDTVYRIAEEGARTLIRNQSKEIRQVFDVLLQPENYPVVFHGSSGKGRVGILSALILSALDINDDLILEDYRLSNKYFNITQFSKFAFKLPAQSQEAITTLLSSRENFLIVAKQECERLYGSVDNYLKKAIGLDKEDIKKLQGILLEKAEIFS